MVVAHNGNLVNAEELKEELELKGAIFHTNSDAEIIAHVVTEGRLATDSIEKGIELAMDRLKGAYSMVMMSATKLIAVRDPEGFRPLCIGEKEGAIIFASETCALDSLGAKYLREVDPGEIVVVDKAGMRSIRTHCKGKGHVCVFEYVYFARPDSVVEGASVHEARQRAGAVQADVVIGVPDSGLDAALGFSKQSGIPYGVGFIKNRYVGRTFIQPTQAMRENAVRIKLNALSATVKGKRVVLVDDSIVRGTTSRQIVVLLREAGAVQVHLRISAPPFIAPCYFGTDIPDSEHLIAHDRSPEEICALTGADSLGFLPLKILHQIAPDAGCGFCDGCFTGNYPIRL